MFERFIPMLKILALVGAFAAGSYVEDLRNDNATLTKENTTLIELNARKDQVHDLEQQLAASQTEAATAYEEGRRNAQASADSSIAAFRAGNLKLRKQLQCTTELLRSVPDATTTGSLPIPTGNCGLSTADVEFLVRFAAETNRLRDKVNSLIFAYNSAKIKLDQLNNASKDKK